ncbi:MAG TPA: DMT family transporter [Methylomirabilota bacterium]|nr:DMT family transporter [Methylomirabilota bacterium]
MALPLRACLELAAAMTIVGSSVVVGKVAVARLPIFLLSGLRFAVASAILVLLVLALGRPLPRLARRDVAVLGLQAFAGIFAFNALLLEGLRFTSAAEGGIVTSTTPAVAAALAVVALGERWSRQRSLGVTLAVAGMLALALAGGGFRERGSWPLLGNLLIFGAVVGEAIFVVCSRVAAQRLPPLVVAAAISVLGFLMFLPAAVWEARAFPLSALTSTDWAIVTYYGVLVTVVAFLLWARGVARVPAGAASVFTGILPVSALALSYLALGESVTPAHLMAAALVVGGIVVLARGG